MDDVEPSRLDLAGTLSTEEAGEIREAIRESEERSRERLDRLTNELGSELDSY